MIFIQICVSALKIKKKQSEQKADTLCIFTKVFQIITTQTHVTNNLIKLGN